MSCYFRHMKDLLHELGVEVTAENKKSIDAVFHRAVGVEYKNCPAAWKAVKAQIKGDEKSRARFLQKIKKYLP